MRRLTASLVAATAATAALSILPLALASTASAATTSATTYTPMVNWAGYVATMSASQTDKFGFIQANFTIPKTSCSSSTESGYKIPKGQLYSAVAYWVGLGGVGEPLEQGGIMVTCASKTATPKIQAFQEMLPRQGNAQFVKLNKWGLNKPIQAGDVIVAQVSDLSTSSGTKPGKSYRVQITDVTKGTETNLAPTNGGVTGNDSTAEVVTEAINDGPWVAPWHTGIAHFQPVSYSGITLGLNGGGYTWGIGTAESWTSALYYVHGGPGGLLGLGGHKQTLISTGGLARGGHAFTNYWHAY